MPKVQTIIWTEICTLSKSMLKWDVTGFWQTFEDVHNSDIWDICWFFINQNLLFYQRVRDLVIRVPPGFRLNRQVSSSARCCGSHAATGVRCINSFPSQCLPDLLSFMVTASCFFQQLMIWCIEERRREGKCPLLCDFGQGTVFLVLHQKWCIFSSANCMVVRLKQESSSSLFPRPSLCAPARYVHLKRVEKALYYEKETLTFVSEN